MANEFKEADFDEVLSGYVAQPDEKIGIFDYLFGSYIVVMLATNYSAYNDLLSTIGMAIPVLFLFSLFFTRYHFQREFFILMGLYVWIVLGSLASDYRAVSFITTSYVLKIQFVMMVVALRCNSLQRMRFYLATAAIGMAYLVAPSLYSKTYLQIDVRLKGTVGQANALANITTSSIVAWGCCLVTSRANECFTLGEKASFYNPN